LLEARFYCRFSGFSKRVLETGSKRVKRVLVVAYCTGFLWRVLVAGSRKQFSKQVLETVLEAGSRSGFLNQVLETGSQSEFSKRVLAAFT
jgi:hypothetical protein